MQSKASTAKEYIDNLPPDRKKAIQAVRKVILKNLPKGYKESIQWGMITYVVPLSMYPKGYGENKNVPLPFLSLASQKNYMSLYLMNIYGDKGVQKWFKDAYKKSGKKLDMGKACLRFKKVEDLALDVIAKSVAIVPVKKHIENYKKARKL